MPLAPEVPRGRAGGANEVLGGRGQHAADQRAERAVDRALAEGTISPELPFVRKKAVEVLRAGYPDRATASWRIVESLAEYYRGAHPAVYSNVGHEDFPRCFRCHDDKHKSADGKVIRQDGNAGHVVLAMEESDPRVLAELGLE